MFFKLPKLVYRLWLMVYGKLKKPYTIYHIPYTKSQKGIAHIALLLFLIGGIAVGTYLVQNNTDLFPRAACDDEGNCSDDEPADEDDSGDDGDDEDDTDEQEADRKAEDERIKQIEEERKQEEDERKQRDEELKDKSDNSEEDCGNAGGRWKDGRCFTGSSSNDDGKNDEEEREKVDQEAKEIMEEQGGPLKEEKPDEEDKRPAEVKAKDKDCEKEETTYCHGGKAIRKHGGYSTNGKDCAFAFDEFEGKDSACSGAQDGDVVDVSKEEQEAFDKFKEEEAKINGKSVACQSVVYCHGQKAYRSVKTFNEETGQCTDAQVSSNSSLDKECADVPDKDNGKVIDGSAVNVDMSKADYKTDIQRADFVVKAKLQREDLNKLLADATGGTGALPEDIKAAVEGKLGTAKTAVDEATAAANDCESANSSGAPEAANTCSEARLKQIKATALSREALAVALKEGVEGARVKVDLQIGEANKNPGIIARSSDGKGAGRVFAALVNGTVQYVVRNTNGELKNAVEEDLKKAGLTQNQPLEDFRTFIDPRLQEINRVNQLISGNPASAIAPLISDSAANPQVDSIPHEPPANSSSNVSGSLLDQRSTIDKSGECFGDYNCKEGLVCNIPSSSITGSCGSASGNAKIATIEIQNKPDRSVPEDGDCYISAQCSEQGARCLLNTSMTGARRSGVCRIRSGTDTLRTTDLGMRCGEKVAQCISGSTCRNGTCQKGTTSNCPGGVCP